MMKTNILLFADHSRHKKGCINDVRKKTIKEGVKERMQTSINRNKKGSPKNKEFCKRYDNQDEGV